MCRARNILKRVLYLLQRAMRVAHLTLLLRLDLGSAIVVGHHVLVLGTPALGLTVLDALAHSIARRPVAEQPREAVQNLLRHCVLVRNLRRVHLPYG